MHRPRPVRPTRLILAVALLLALVLGPVGALAREIQDEILTQTAILRGLPPKGPVPFAFADPTALRNDLLKSYNDEKAVRELETSRKLLVLLGLLDSGADLHGLLVNLYAENVLGYYNRNDKKMYVVSSESSFKAETKVTLAHEYTHALQDQYFDLGRVEALAENNGDRDLAITALIEGDATLTMLLYARTFLNPDEQLQFQASGSESSLDRAPLVVRDEVIFPYDEGVFFAIRLWQDGGFDALNQAFLDPPQSTEQIIHPEKYLARERPIAVTLPDLAAALGPGWTQLRTDVLGELDLRILLKQFNQSDDTVNAAGWGGDRFSLLEHSSGQRALVMSTVWDSERDAGRYFGEYSTSVTRRFGAQARPLAESEGSRLWVTPGGPLLLRLQGTRLAIIMAPTEGVLSTLSGALGLTAPAQPAPPAQAPAPVPAPVQLPK